MFYPDCSVHLFTGSDSPSAVWAVVTIMDSLDHRHIRRGRTSSSPGSISWSSLPIALCGRGNDGRQLILELYCGAAAA